MNEVVKYSNTLNTLQFKGFTAMDYNVLMCLCHKLRDKGSKEIDFTFKELKELTEFGNHSNQEFANELDKMVGKLLQVNATHISGDDKTRFVLFPTFTTNAIKGTLKVSVNEKFTYILNELTDNFTRFELKEFAELDGKYAKSLYRILKQYKHSGWWNPTIEELRIVLDIPPKYSSKMIMQSCLTPALKALEDKFNDLKCKPIRAKKRGAPVEKYYFTWQAENQLKGQTNINDALDAMNEYNASKKKPKKAPKKNTFTTMESSPDNPKTKEDWAAFEKKVLDN